MDSTQRTGGFARERTNERALVEKFVVIGDRQRAGRAYEYTRVATMISERVL